MEYNKINELLEVIKSVVKNPLLHLPFAGNILAVLKPAMQESGIDAYPILCLIGAPQSGKTTVARRIVIDKPKDKSALADNEIENSIFYIITDIYVSKLKKILAKRPNDYVVLDDFAVFQDNDTKRKASRFLDEIVRPSYAGSSALLLITAESGAFDKITGSLHSRMIKLNMDNWKSNKKNKRLLEDIFRLRHDFSSMLQDFSEWTAKQQLDIHSQNVRFQQKYQGIMDDRSISLFFTYDFSMEVFSKFLEENYHTSFSMDTFRSSYKAIWKKNSLKSLNREELVKYLFRKLLEDGAFECKTPSVKQLCISYCNGECSKYHIHNCHGDTGQCDDFYQNAKAISGNYYDPYEMLMNSQSNSALLISNAEYIFGMPKYKKIAVPLFIVPQNSLINMLNDALEKFCIEMGESRDCFKPKELTSLLDKNKMCVFRISGNHPCYTFSYMVKDGTERDIPVYILRITRDEYKTARNKNPQDRNKQCIDSMRADMLYDDYSNMPSKLQWLCKELQWRYECDNSYTKDNYSDIEP